METDINYSMIQGGTVATRRTDNTRADGLGRYLANLRKAKGFTLREVEEATGKEVSNAYLSQLEHDRISKPSPNILYNLANVYGVSYEMLLEKAGYITASADRIEGEKHGRIPTFAIEDLTPEEEEKVLEYMAFLRSIRKRRP